MTDSAPRLTYAQAADLLDCHVSNIPKYIRRGLLTSHGGRGTKGGSLDRREVEALARGSGRSRGVHRADV